ncbi:MAG TPA: HlyD family efflux transporter periplasmic adaptor subunit [Phycisphaerae bacterium]|nr:HlyD family efflux transporter periplasmic adaptor subunit [Phycisphaerae bacterium]
MTRDVLRWFVLAITLGLSIPGCSPDDDEEEAGETHHAESQPVARNERGETVVTLDVEDQKNAGIVTQPLVAGALQPELTAYGRLEEDPSQSFTLRAPVAGMVKPPDSGTWPRLGQTQEDGVLIGRIEPRLSPVERADLASRLSAAHGEMEEVSAELSAAQASYESKKQLNIQGHIVSDRAMEEAEARVKGAEARLKTAVETIRLIEASLTATSGPTEPLVLRLVSGGEVVEVGAQPGESLEAGQTILRVARYDRLLARVELPVGEFVRPPPRHARVVVVGRDERPWQAQAAAIAPAINPLTGGEAFLFLFTSDDPTLRPGLAIVAYIALTGEAQKGAIIPRSAVVRLEGGTWIYVKSGEQEFTRRAVNDLRPTEAGWFAAGLDPDQIVVVTGAQALLSTEFTSRAVEEEEE